MHARSLVEKVIVWTLLFWVMVGWEAFFENSAHISALNNHTIYIALGIFVLGIFQILIYEIKRFKVINKDNEISKFSFAIEQSPNMIIVLDREGIVEYVNDTYLSSNGITREDIIGHKENIFNLSAEGSKEFMTNMLAGLEWTTERQGVKKDGEVYWEYLRVKPIITKKEGLTYFLMVIEDITQRKMAEEKINYMAFHDPLTSLPNRRFLNIRLNNAIEDSVNKSEILAVMFIDLDRLKLINDNFGHAVGDKILLEVARRLSNSVEANSTVARLGGDEFALVMPHITSIEQVNNIANKILDTIQVPFVLDSEEEIYLSSSIGVALYPEHGTSAEELLKKADTAMYWVKEQGKNGFQIYTDALEYQNYDQLLMQNGLSRGLKNNEFRIYYQPKVNVSTGVVIGMEALMRWEHPVKGIIKPTDFIPHAEKTGLIVPLGEWALRTACAQNKAWQQQGMSHISIAVNISARQFKETNFVGMVAKVLEDTGLEPQWLELEITESLVMQDAERSIKNLTELRNMGIHIAIDDFGTGYSSLNYLKKFPITSLKIDKSFVQELTSNVNDNAIINAIISLAHSLNLDVIAEGVETVEHIQFLQERNCHKMQGYYFGKPMPSHQVSEALPALNKKIV
jgi:diguanylate cyclase (GGDEF)-like protein/PAS domain S-box-containing protein